MIIIATLLSALIAPDCHDVTADVIRAADLASIQPIFARLEPEMMVGYSPMPGAMRILQAAQLERLAYRNGIDGGEYRDICFQRAMRELDAQELLAAIRQSIGIADASVELTDFSHFPAPVGDLVFPRSGLSLSSSSYPEALLWRGYVSYGSGHQFPIWARVNIRTRLNRVVALDNLVGGAPVRPDQVKIEPLNGVPDALAPAQSTDVVVGKSLVRPVRRGATISLDDLAGAVVVRRGSKVEVDFKSGLLHLKFQAAAEVDGRFGDRIRLRNLQSGNTFVAEVSGNNEARVVPEN
jgi:flagella basal body P-ring formation protein FlgA